MNLREATAYEALRHTFNVNRVGKAYQIWDVENDSWVYQKVGEQYIPRNYMSRVDAGAIIKTCSLNAGYYVIDKD